ncbi:MAG TPA: tetratricopeptide repeat protein [Gammaproteobacteria bacterium]
MPRVLTSGLALCALAGPGWGQLGPPDNRTVLGADQYLSAGAEAIRMGRYDDGIRLTEIGLDRTLRRNDKAAGLSNLCAAHAAKGEPDRAIEYCSESLAIDPNNWRAYSNRSYAYYLKGMFEEAKSDLDVAASINPDARQLAQIQGLINERTLRPRVITEDHQ